MNYKSECVFAFCSSLGCCCTQAGVCWVCCRTRPLGTVAWVMKDSLLIQEGLREIPLHPQPQTSSEGQTIPEGVCVYVYVTQICLLCK